MARLLHRKKRRVLIDIDTQFDLIAAANIDEKSIILRNMRRIIAWARLNQVPIISTTLARRPDQKQGCCAPPVRCVEGTAGQRKLSFILCGSRKRFGPEAAMDLPRQLFEDYQQVVFEKRVENPFELPRADRLLSEIKADELLVFGMGLENAVKATVLGLLHRKKKVTLITDATAGFEYRPSVLALRQIEAKGAHLVKTAALAGKGTLVGRPRLHYPGLDNPFSSRAAVGE